MNNQSFDRCLYLHGFTSSINSYKANYFRKKFAEKNIDLEVVDFNKPDFFNLSLTRQIEQVSTIINQYSESNFILIGSSFGGATANWIGHKFPHRIKSLILLAPAFNFGKSWQPKLTKETLNEWQEKGSISIYHYGEKKELLLSYHFWQDLTTYDDSIINHDIPTLIFHGIEDETIPIEVSREYAKVRSNVTLKEFHSDHTLNDCLEQIYPEIFTFIGVHQK